METREIRGRCNTGAPVSRLKLLHQIGRRCPGVKLVGDWSRVLFGVWGVRHWGLQHTQGNRWIDQASFSPQNLWPYVALAFR